MTAASLRIAPLDPASADPAVAATLAGVKAKLGVVPNLFRTFARSPAALDGYLALSDALAGGRLSAGQREIVALSVGQANRCGYCLAAHTLIGKGAGLSETDIHAARTGTGAGRRLLRRGSVSGRRHHRTAFQPSGLRAGRSRASALYSLLPSREKGWG